MEALVGEAKWREVLPLAGQAKALLATGGVPAHLHQRVTELEADADLMERLEAIHVSQIESMAGRLDLDKAPSDYAKTFHDAGIDIEELEPVEAVQRIRQRTIRDHLVTVLEDWARLHVPPSLKERLIAIAQEAGSEASFVELRQARSLKDKAALQKMADSIDVPQRSALDLLRLGFALQREEDNDAAVSLLLRAHRRYRGDFYINLELGRLRLIQRPPQLDQAIQLNAAALAVRSESPALHLLLGLALARKGNLDEAIAAFGEACRLKPDYALAHYNLGSVLDTKGRLNDAIAAFEEAIRLDPGWAEPCNSLGISLSRKGLLGPAIAAYRKAIQLQPSHPLAHTNLGIALDRQGNLEEALLAFEEDRRFHPGSVQVHINLASVLERLGRYEEAIAAAQEALRLNPDSAEASCALGFPLQKRGEFTKAVEAFRRGHELGTKVAGWSLPSGQWLKDAQRLAELAPKLPEFLRGSAKPADADECIALANLCQIKKLPGSAARFHEMALAAHPAGAEDVKTGRRYNAACMAALAGCFPGKEDSTLTEAARARWREQALAWLRADLAVWTNQLESGQAEARAKARQMLGHWRRDPDLAGIREEASLAKLPPTESQVCRQFWTEVRHRLEKAGNKD
jgi:Flp pilus assembly protein TadD